MTAWRLFSLRLATAFLGLSLGACAVQPDPLDPEAVQARIERDRLALMADQPPVTEPLTLAEAKARALLFNRDRRVATMQAAFAQRQATAARFDMLPQLTAQAGYTGRSNRSASSSTSILTEQESLEPSTSTDRHRLTSDVTFMWNILDFAVSYVRAGQQADRFQIALEQQRRVVHTLMADVTQAWWRAYAAQRLLPRLEPLMQRVDRALAQARELESLQIQPVAESLAYQRTLLDTLRGLHDLRADLITAQIELERLINLRPGSGPVTLAVPEAADLPETLPIAMDVRERIALSRRPELLEEDYRTRIARDEVIASIGSLLPAITIDFGWNYDSNSFLVNKTWLDYAGSISFNLFRVFSAPYRIDMAETGQLLADERRLAVSMTVLAQVHLAEVAYRQARTALDLMTESLEVDRRLAEDTLRRYEQGQAGELQVIRDETRSLVAALRHGQAMARMRTAWERVFTSMGLDPIPGEIEQLDLATVRAAIADRAETWRALQTEVNGEESGGSAFDRMAGQVGR